MIKKPASVIVSPVVDSPRLDRGVHDGCKIPRSRGLATGSRSFSGETMTETKKPASSGRMGLLIWALVGMLCCCQMAIAEVTVRVDPPKVALGESFRITFTLDSSEDNLIPDLTPLQTHFTIAGTERSLSYSMVNGQAHSLSQWTVILIPKKTGLLPIPAIQMGQQKSPATQVEVSGDKAPVSADEETKPSSQNVMLKTTISQQDPYVNQQVIYTVKLYSNQSLLDVEYQPPQVEDAIFIPLGDSRRYQTVINGQHYEVEEQRYAISPQRSGDLVITPPRLKALVFDVAAPRRVRVQAKTTQLKVKPVPSHYTGKHWLPSKQVTLLEQYDQNQTSMKEGDTLIRTITLQAVGVPAQLLPTLPLPQHHSFSSYAAPPEVHNVYRNQAFIGSQTIKITYLLNKVGNITLPAIQIPWFNTTTNQEEMATLPERTIEVTSSGTLSSSKPLLHAPDTAKPSQHAIALSPAGGSFKKSAYPLASWLAAGFAFAWLITLGLWWNSRRKATRSTQLKQAFATLRHACQNNDPKAVQRALLQWASIQWPNAAILNLSQLSDKISDATFKNQLSLLSKALFAAPSLQSWQANELWRCILAFKPNQAKPPSGPQANDLPPINPN